MSKDLYFQERQQELADIVSGVENGERDALIIYAELKRYEDIVKACKDQIEPLAFEQSEQWNEKSFQHEGIEFEKRSGGISYSFKNIPEWVEKKKELKEIEEISKQAYKSHQKNILTATNDGEEIILPEISYRKDSLVVKKK